jgi:hypothetical protein
MNTFLPYPDFDECAGVLDNRRLNKQIIEAYQIFRANLGVTKGWRNHPATLMWKDCLMLLSIYHQACVREWQRRGRMHSLSGHLMLLGYDIDWTTQYLPTWLGNEKLHASHRSNLLRKDPVWYGKFGWMESNDMEYWWPSHHQEVTCT